MAGTIPSKFNEKKELGRAPEQRYWQIPIIFAIERQELYLEFAGRVLFPKSKRAHTTLSIATNVILMTADEESELLALTRENNAILKRILAYTDMVQSAAYQDNAATRSLIINLLADVLVDNAQSRLNQNKPYS